jgi:hypothetical protein
MATDLRSAAFPGLEEGAPSSQNGSPSRCGRSTPPVSPGASARPSTPVESSKHASPHARAAGTDEPSTSASEAPAPPARAAEPRAAAPKVALAEWGECAGWVTLRPGGAGLDYHGVVSCQPRCAPRSGCSPARGRLVRVWCAVAAAAGVSVRARCYPPPAPHCCAVGWAGEARRPVLSCRACVAWRGAHARGSMRAAECARGGGNAGVRASGPGRAWRGRSVPCRALPTRTVSAHRGVLRRFKVLHTSS